MSFCAAVSLARADRYLDVTARARMLGHNSVEAMNMFNMKYTRDVPTQGGVLGGDPVRQAPPPSSGLKKKAAPKPPLVASPPVASTPSKPAPASATAATPSPQTVAAAPRQRAAAKPAAPGPSPHAWPQSPQSWIPQSAIPAR